MIIFYHKLFFTGLLLAAFTACSKPVDYHGQDTFIKEKPEENTTPVDIGELMAVDLPSIFSDNMVLQQNTKVAIWGSTTASKYVVVKGSWSSDSTVVRADKNGNWITYLKTASAGGPWTVSINNTVLKNVMTGEVWYCSGQSNMVMAMHGTVADKQPVDGSEPFIKNANPSVPIRMCTIGTKTSLTPLTSCTGAWKENNPTAVESTSAVAYFFALKLNEILHIPIGIMISAVGGSPIEAFMNQETISTKFSGEFNLSFLNSGSLPADSNTYPCTLFNGQVNPLVPFTFKGFLWYQGENNRDRPSQYTRLQIAYVEMLRSLFNNPNAPFYFVQIAPYTYGNPTAEVVGFFNEAQSKTLSSIKSSGMVTTVDIGSSTSIHPGKKKQVGERLAYYALYNDYGIKTINPVGPTFKSVEFKDGSAIIKMNVDDRGLEPTGVDLSGFRVAGADKIFKEAKAVAAFDTITVSCKDVTNPVAVRYCFTNWSVGSIFNRDGIPAGPFRTDNW